jgi:hypothetical protein
MNLDGIMDHGWVTTTTTARSISFNKDMGCWQAHKVGSRIPQCILRKTMEDKTLKQKSGRHVASMWPVLENKM